jgi:hypothetical protein
VPSREKNKVVPPARKTLKLKISHTASVPRDPVTTFRVLSRDRGELTSLFSVGLPTRAIGIDEISPPSKGQENATLHVSLTRGNSFDYQEISRKFGSSLHSRMTNFRGPGSLLITQVDSRWELRPKSVPGNSLGHTAVVWTTTFRPRSVLARHALKMWLTYRWRKASAQAMRTNLLRVTEFEQPGMGAGSRPA